MPKRPPLCEGGTGGILRCRKQSTAVPSTSPRRFEEVPDRATATRSAVAVSPEQSAKSLRGSFPHPPFGHPLPEGEGLTTHSHSGVLPKKMPKRPPLCEFAKGGQGGFCAAANNPPPFHRPPLVVSKRCRIGRQPPGLLWQFRLNNLSLRGSFPHPPFGHPLPEGEG
jgi:hypothetical protein